MNTQGQAWLHAYPNDPFDLGGHNNGIAWEALP